MKQALQASETLENPEIFLFIGLSKYGVSMHGVSMHDYKHWYLVQAPITSIFFYGVGESTLDLKYFLTV